MATNGCLEVKRMDNPALSSIRQEDFNDFIGAIAGGISSGERMPLMVYRVYVADGREELVRGSHIEGLQLRRAAEYSGDRRRRVSPSPTCRIRRAVLRARRLARSVQRRAESEHDHRAVTLVG